ncbi:hypothetical protein BD410DRAFT_842215 [Rickenella mellea]|uniref:Uncharacterized protein n=1 Tax=Rickenella mellea TaxID=50990 RepID=A0A4Y7PXP6_9AGAM|nr:hypothetical protein BD410DRAFT_842215 [Rickenella mellea]
MPIKTTTKSPEKVVLRKSSPVDALVKAQVQPLPFPPLRPSGPVRVWHQEYLDMMDVLGTAHYSSNRIIASITPDDVWISILSQLNFYLSAHAEELRGKFVSHDGQKGLIVECDGDRNHADFEKLAEVMSEALNDNVATSLKEMVGRQHRSIASFDL